VMVGRPVRVDKVCGMVGGGRISVRVDKRRAQASRLERNRKRDGQNLSHGASLLVTLDLASRRDPVRLGAGRSPPAGLRLGSAHFSGAGFRPRRSPPQIAT
jgi:hypothetical protein